jgi:tRNA threonylcarbamoyladenosine biosynthesis protein TsaB
VTTAPAGAVLGLDTATRHTVVAVLAPGRDPVALRHVPAPGARPAHAEQLLPLARRALDETGLRFADVARIGAGTGPGTFTGLRIGVATARALAQAGGAELVPVSTLAALAAAAGGDRPVLAVLDARRGEAFAGAWRGGERLLEPVAVAPDRLAGLTSATPDPWLAVGDGAVRFRDQLEPAGVEVPPDDDLLHAVSALAICRLAQDGDPVAVDALVPAYVRAPDAVPPPRRGIGA